MMKELEKDIFRIDNDIDIGRIWFSADAHFNHINIIEYCKRPYQSVDLMNTDMVIKWNNTVGIEDYVIYLGDFSMDVSAYREFMPQLNFAKMLFIVGNHDRINRFKDVISELQMDNKIICKKNAVLQYNDYSFFLTHRPINAHKDMPSICAHVHQHWKSMNAGDTIQEGAPGSNKFRTMKLNHQVVNVGVDQFSFSPINLKHVLSIFDTRGA